MTRKIFLTFVLTIVYAYKAAVRHRSFDGWWRYRFEVGQVWHQKAGMEG